MRTKHLLTAMVLPALFAACTSEDLNVVSNEAIALDSRKVVKDVTINFEDLSTESRLAYGSTGYQWQKNDQIGACLMDVLTNRYRAAGTHWSQWFNMVNHIHTNYKFTRNSAGDWTTEAKMCEGNYFFYYPYDANAGLRTAYSIDRSVQTLAGTDQASLLKAFTSNNAFVGYGKVYAGDRASESVAVNMTPAFGATGVTIKNTGTNTYTIEKIVLRGTAVANRVTINPTTCDQNVQYYSEENTTDYNDSWFNAAQYVGDDWGDPAAYQYWSSYNKLAALQNVLDYNNNGVKENVIEVYVNSGNVVRPQGSINLIAMLRNVNNLTEATSIEDVAGENEVILDIHTDKGLIRDIKLTYHYTATNGSMNDDARITNVLTDRALTAVGDGKSVLVTFDDTSLDTPKIMDINGEDELANLIHWNAKSEAAITANLLTDITITKAMYNELAASKITTATINGANNTYNVTIAADVPVGALDRFTFTGVDAIKVKGTQTMKIAKTCRVVVESGATLNVEANKNFTTIRNKGTLNIKSNLSGIGTIENQANGVMNVTAGKTIASNVGVINGCQTEWYENAVLNNNGTIERVDNDTYGTINNNGVLGTEAQVGYIAALANQGTINNNGKVFIAKNSGNVYANGTSTTRMNVNGGNIIITNLEENGNFLAGKMGTIVQEVKTPTNTDAIDVRANMIWLSSTLKVEKKDAAGNYVNVDLNTPARNGLVQITAKGANARIDGNGQNLRMSHITVNADAKLVINKVDAYIAIDENAGDRWGMVTMNGYSNHRATITINSNASLKAYYGVMATLENTWNVIDNNSSSTVIGTEGTVGNI